ncbi:MAG: hypothetical protein IPL08_11320 [Saprospiraceae bacterium]|nr:hypothetical protein [Saprospiraceae bacterium]
MSYLIYRESKNTTGLSFNILQEGDLQIRGFKLELPLDISFCVYRQSEDYTNKGNIITPLKDRIESQIRTHYQGA